MVEGSVGVDQLRNCMRPLETVGEREGGREEGEGGREGGRGRGREIVQL